MSRSRSPQPPDMASAWAAHAPELPPPRPRSRMASSSRPASPLIPPGRSQSLEFDAATRGGELPPSSFSPAPERPASRTAPERRLSSAADVPERPVSRNAMSRERAAQRSRTESAASAGVAPPAHYSPHSASPAPGEQPRTRYDSNPAAPAAAPHGYYGHPPPQPWQTSSSYDTPGPSQIQTAPPPAQYAYAPQHQHPAYAQPHVPQPPYHDPQQMAYLAQQQHYPPAHVQQPGPPGWQGHPPPHQYQHGAPWPGTATPPQAPYYAAPPAHAAYAPAQSSYPSSPVTYAPAPWQQPPPPSPGQAPYVGAAPPHAYGQPVPGVPPGASPVPGGRPLPQPGGAPMPPPARSPSLPSSAGSGLTSAPSVRRTLPQPPPGASPVMPPPAGVLPAQSINRADSLRMAADALMARGPPRRGTGTLGRIAAQNSMSPSSSSVPSSPSTQQHFPPRGSVPPSPSIQSVPSTSGSVDSIDSVTRDFAQIGMSSSGSAGASGSAQVQVPMPPPPRPSSRGPRDDLASGRERRASTPGHSNATPTPSARSTPRPASVVLASPASIPVIHSPPPDTKPPMPTISFDDDPPTSPARGPTIVVGQPSRAMPSISVVADAPPSISVQPSPPAPSIAVQSDDAPSIAVSGPSISIAGVDDEDDETVSAIKPSISISHSGPLASPQRVSPSASPAATVRGTGGINGSDAASAPTLGSGYGCGTCGKWIGGRVVSAMGQRFHPACFACSHCSEPLEHVAFYEHEGKAFCHFDYHELFSRRCFHCRTPIVDERFITISDPQLVGATDDPNASAERSYHDLHFFCANCGDPFLDPKAAGSVAGADPNGLGVDEEGNVRAGGREFVVWKGYPYCEKCHINLHKPRCKGCRQPIADGDIISALRGKWHPHCFVCEACRRPFESPNFFIRGDKAYDEDCYKVLLRSEL